MTSTRGCRPTPEPGRSLRSVLGTRGTRHWAWLYAATASRSNDDSAPPPTIRCDVLRAEELWTETEPAIIPKKRSVCSGSAARRTVPASRARAVERRELDRELVDGSGLIARFVDGQGLLDRGGREPVVDGPASNSASRKASRDPLRRDGVLVVAGVPTSAQPGPNGVRKKFGRSAVPKNRSSRLPADRPPGRGSAKIQEVAPRCRSGPSGISARPEDDQTPGRRWSGTRRRRPARGYTSARRAGRRSSSCGRRTCGPASRCRWARGARATGECRAVRADHDPAPSR